MPTSLNSQPRRSQALCVASNFTQSRGLSRSAGRQPITIAQPSWRRAKQSGACEIPLPFSAAQKSQKGWDDKPVTAGSKSSSIT